MSRLQKNNTSSYSLLFARYNDRRDDDFPPRRMESFGRLEQHPVDIPRPFNNFHTRQASSDYTAQSFDRYNSERDNIPNYHNNDRNHPHQYHGPEESHHGHYHDNGDNHEGHYHDNQEDLIKCKYQQRNQQAGFIRPYGLDRRDTFSPMRAPQGYAPPVHVPRPTYRYESRHTTVVHSGRPEQEKFMMAPPRAPVFFKGW